MSDDFSAFRAEFLPEATDLLGRLEAGLLEMRSGSAPEETIHAMFRAAHTIKGGSGSVLMPETERFTHGMENVLDALRAGKIRSEPSTVQLLLEGVDALRSLLDLEGNGQPVPPSEFREKLVNAYKDISSGRAPAASGNKPTRAIRPRVVRVYFKPAAGLFESPMDPLPVLEAIAGMGQVRERHLHIAEVPALEELNPARCCLAWEVILETTATADELRGQFLMVEDGAKLEVMDLTPADLEERAQRRAKSVADALVEDGVISPKVAGEAVMGAEEQAELALVKKARLTGRIIKEAAGAQQQAKRAVESSSIRVDTVKLDMLVNVIGELVIDQARLTRLASLEGNLELQSVVESMERLARSLQEQVLRVRMVPVANTFNLCRRIVHDAGEKTGKKVRLDIEGGETEIDKTVVEQLADPLKHMVRNAVDHGLEGPADRKKAGKPEEGVLKLSAAHRDGMIVVTLQDDGRGISAEKVRKKAIERGLISAAANLSPQELRQLIFEPGFSTAEQVTELSGRGVGLDVVRRNVQALHGTVELDSVEGQGTTFRVRLPLTLAIADGQIVQVASRFYVVPLLAVVENLRPVPGQVRTIEGQGEVIRVRGQVFPLVRLHEFYHLPGARTNPEEALVVIIGHADQPYALMVDEVVGMQSVVVKALRNDLPRSPGVAAATILGDGSVAFILDTRSLFTGAFGSLALAGA